jgi:DNA-directed RNA polymerase specialized sigma24 family protein
VFPKVPIQETENMAFDRRQAIQNHAAQLYGYAVSLCSDPTLAEDLAQEAITKAIVTRRGARGCL